jgi:hypothetical protein
MPHRSMSSAAHRLLLYPIVAGLLCAACACVSFLALPGSERRMLSLRELASQGSVLMSCADERGPGSALLWCADPDSPHCIPALPDAPGTDLAQHGPLAVLTPLATAARPSIGRLMAWPEPRLLALTPTQLAQRLDRPPKCV